MSNNFYDDDIILIKKKKNNKKSFLIFLLSLIGVFAVIIAFFVIRHYYNSRNEISFDNYDVYQYFGSIKYPYNGVLKYENGNLINVDDAGGKADVGNYPIYFQNIENECILPSNMGLFFLKDKGKNYRVNYFSRLISEMSDDEMAFVSYDKKYYIDNAFLYDGSDLYVFPYSVKLQVDDKELMLSPLSYVIVNYKDSVEVYDRKTDTYTIIDESNNDVIAYMNDYKINLSSDMIMYENDDRLLIKSINKLNIYDGS